MSSLICRERLDFLSDDQKAELSRYFSEPNKNAMPHQLAILLGIEYHRALKILVVLEAEEMSSNLLLLYHFCTEEPIDAMPLKAGFPEFPYQCPHCEEIISHPNEMGFDFLGKIEKSIEFI